jgi:hypothetical protein
MADGEHVVLVNATEAPALIALGFVELGEGRQLIDRAG